MLKELELLAPAGNRDIGIAAVDCGADAVYMAGPSFGARESAGNPVRDIAALARYARQFGVKVYVTVNTILRENELEPARKLIIECYEAGCDAIIVQDMGILDMDLPPIDLFASTQCNIRTPDQARWLESLGFKRLILARELSLEQIRDIRAAVTCDLETFVHGALCVSYSGQCYMSCHLAGRSANRGECIQACRSRYDLMDSAGRTLLKGKAVLSLKDLNLSDRLPDLIDAGVTSFKIEGRLKNASYVKNTVRRYRKVIDDFLDGGKGMQYRHSSFGVLQGGFEPSLEATFTRGFTDFFIDGKRGEWSSMDTAKGIGERMGNIMYMEADGGRNVRFVIEGNPVIHNGDGLCFRNDEGEVTGVRADVVSGTVVETKALKGLKPGVTVYRNLNISFERELEKNMPHRFVRVELKLEKGKISAISEDGRNAECALGDVPSAENRELAERNIITSLGKLVPPYAFRVVSLPQGDLPFLPASGLNALRRKLAGLLDEQNFRPVKEYELSRATDRMGSIMPPAQKVRLNCSNSSAAKVYEMAGIMPSDAFELDADISGEYGELMRTK
ncbi:MAG: U32 family peptidase, partial [Alistipes sp.]|nr:U32 family peptidase [Candidatus Minthomonas equi]